MIVKNRNLKANKYRPGQTVFYMNDNRIRSGVIGTVEIKVKLVDGFKPETSDVHVEVKYGLINGALVPNGGSHSQDSLYSSKAALIKKIAQQ